MLYLRAELTHYIYVKVNKVALNTMRIQPYGGFRL